MFIETIAAVMLVGAVQQVEDDYGEIDNRPILTLNDVDHKLRPYFISFYPKSAAYRGIEGDATVVCYIRRNGDVGTCTVEKETPPSAEFGNATIRHFIRSLWVAPATKAGEPTAGRRIRLSRAWRITSRWEQRLN
jgi:TonB family protein